MTLPTDRAARKTDNQPATARLSESEPAAPAGWLVPIAEAIALGVTVVASGVLLVCVLRKADRGFDFSDEGYYLNSIASPQLYHETITQFGFVYHPLYRAVDGDIALLRRINILITVGLAWILSTLLLRNLDAGEAEPQLGRRRLALGFLGFVFATSTLMIVRLWMPTPNYNTLTLQSLLVAAIGMVLATANYSRPSFLGWVLIGVGGWLTFMAKPTSAAALSVVVGVYLFAARKLRFRLLAVSLGIVVILALGSAWLMDGSVPRFVARILHGMQDSSLQQGKHTVIEAVRLDEFGLHGRGRVILFLATLVIFLSTCLANSKLSGRRFCGIVLGAVFSLICLAVAGGLLAPRATPTEARFWGLHYLAGPVAASLAALAISLRKFPELISRERIALAAAFTILPHVYAFGTDDNYWAASTWAAIFWLLAGVVMLALNRSHQPSWHSYLPIAAAAQICTATILSVYMTQPYRQTQPLRQQEEAIQIAVTGAKLRVSPDFAIYLRRLHELASKGGYHPGSPMLDLTGHYPGALYAIGAKAIGRPWMIGAYPGSNDLAIAALDRVPREELKNAWILMEPDGPRKLSPQLLERYDLALERDYLDVGVIDSPTGTYPNSYKQHLLKPVRPSDSTPARSR